MPGTPPISLLLSPHSPSSQLLWYLCRMKKEDDSLTIFGVAERDQGTYTCFASTELDQDLAKAHLTVLGNCCCPWHCPRLPSPHRSAAREAVGPGWF